MDSRSTVGMNRADMCPPIPVVCVVECPYLEVRDNTVVVALRLTMNTRVEPDLD